jgi:hypothetical protein
MLQDVYKYQIIKELKPKSAPILKNFFSILKIVESVAK